VPRLGKSPSGPLRRDPDPTDDEAIQASNQVLEIALAGLAGYQLTGDDAIDAVRALRASLHGFLSLELQAGGFGLPDDVDRSFERIIIALAQTSSTWPPSTIGANTSGPDLRPAVTMLSVP